MSEDLPNGIRLADAGHDDLIAAAEFFSKRSKDSTVRFARETHTTSDGASAAKNCADPINVPPRSLSKNPGRKSVRAAVSRAKPENIPPPTPSTKRSKAARPAIPRVETASTSPGTSLRGDRLVCDTHVHPVSARRSKRSTKPILAPSGENSEGHQVHGAHALEGRAIPPPNPTRTVPDHSLRDGQQSSVTHQIRAVASDDHATHTALVIAQIRELWRRRQSWHRAEKSLTLQCKAVCRRFVGGDKVEANKLFATVDGHSSSGTQGTHAVTVAILPLMMARDTVAEHRASVEKELAKLAKTLPIYPWIEAIPGIAAGSLAALVGECGDIGSYKSASALWKRMGLAVINGGRQRRVGGVDALDHGYSPQRRSVMWNIGGGLIGGMGKGPRPKVGEDIEANADWSPYQKEFVRLLRAEVDRVTDTWNGPEHKREPVERKGELYESFSAHAAARIKRRIEKKFLAEFYGAWRSHA